MEHADGTFTCHWCATNFPRRSHTGRKPHYCTATCRQRAYEHRRRGARYPSHPWPAALPARKPAPKRYEMGRHYRLRHALRPAGLPDQRGRRETLCGAWAHTMLKRFGDRLTGPERYCHTCHTITQQHPPTRPIDPPTDLAVITHLITRLPPHPNNADLFTYLGLTHAT
jgi:hypothetical protein